MNASSGSTLAGFENGTGTMDGDEEAATLAPPSNSHECSREYLSFRKSAPALFFHRIVTMCFDIRSVAKTKDPGAISKYFVSLTMMPGRHRKRFAHIARTR